MATPPCLSFSSPLRRAIAPLFFCDSPRRHAYVFFRKGKAKLHQLPTCFSLSLAALRARQPADKDGPSNTASTSSNPIIIISDSEEDSERDPKEGDSEDEDPKMDHEEEDLEMDSAEESKDVPEYIPGAEPVEDEEEAPEYIPGKGPAENQDPKEEEPEEEDPEMDSEEDSEEDPDQDPEDEEMEEPAEEHPNHDIYFADYFELAPPAIQDSSTGSPPPNDD
ncbi:hypothetical protein PIB30_039951 [Stylosanthes scabra]|uniref:Uncharacterized protein n=1 Tax=Stylosanthes scabra TaxID=79078 RepID=A0ABU6TGC5_9FABA|nr:hypothetical protein [Stylosanthes scabra]